MEKFLKTTMWVVLIIAAIVVTLRLTILSWWRIPSDDPAMSASIAPSLFPGDLVILWRAKPKRGDLARCADPDQPGRYVIGRLTGEPTDKVETRGNDVFINNRRATQETICGEKFVEIENPQSGAPEKLYCTIEALGGTKHMRGTKIAFSPQHDRKEIVSSGNVFLISDNRVYPLDSREYGAVHWSSCKESVVFRITSKKGWKDGKQRLTFIH